MKVKNVKISEIIVEDRFRDDMGDVEQLAESIKEKGLLHPIVVNEDNRLLAGGRRLAAFQHLDRTVIPASIVKTAGDNLLEQEIELLENIARKDMTWHEECNLVASLHHMLTQRHGKAVPGHGSGWSQEDTARTIGVSRTTVTKAIELSKAIDVLPELKEQRTADDARRTFNRTLENAHVAEKMKEAKEKRPHAKIIWASDHYKIGDALEGLDKMNAGISDFAEVDPPYGIDFHNKEKGQRREGINEYKEVATKDYPDFIKLTTALVYNVLREDTFCVWWFGPSWHELVRDSLRAAGFKVDDIPAIWYKQGTPGVSLNPKYHLARNYEPFFVARKGTPQLREMGKGNVFVHEGVTAKGRVHATERPVPLIQDILRTFTYPSAKVVSPFLGSGNTIIAAYKENMVAHGWDLSETMKEHFLTRCVKEFPEHRQELEFDKKAETSPKPKPVVEVSSGADPSF